MSASNEWAEHHLTPTGWQQGSSKHDFGQVQERPIPDDRVLTCRYREKMSSSFSRMHCSVSEVWRGEDNELIERLLTEHGSCPQMV